MFKVGDLVWLQWSDHFHEYGMGWRDYEDINDKPLVNESVGWVVKLTKNMITLVSTRDHERNKFSGGYGCKLRNNIVKYKILRKGK